mmetsp:Transcript_8000/g.26186  ORF Transcript_8000/g.26186 Transcript_8000/m.26186 type:complete len:479 (-) Transcript_8000:116-1552(-)
MGLCTQKGNFSHPLRSTLATYCPHKRLAVSHSRSTAGLPGVGSACRTPAGHSLSCACRTPRPALAAGVRGVPRVALGERLVGGEQVGTRSLQRLAACVRLAQQRLAHRRVFERVVPLDVPLHRLALVWLDGAHLRLARRREVVLVLEPRLAHRGEHALRHSLGGGPVDVDPLEGGLGAEPLCLLLRVPARGGGEGVDEGGEGVGVAGRVAGPQQVLERLAVADCAACRVGGEQLALEEQVGHLSQQARLQHRAAPLVDAAAERHARRGEEEAAEVERGAQRVEPRVVGRRGQRCRLRARLHRHHERAVQAVPVVCRQLSGARAVERAQQRKPAFPVCRLLVWLQRVARRRGDRWVGSRRCRAAVHEPPEVHARPSDEDGRLAAREDLVDSGECVGVEGAGGVVVAQLGDVDEVVRRARPLHRRRLVGADLKTAVHLHRVDRDQLARERLTQSHAERRLAHCGRPGDYHHASRDWRRHR